MDEYSPACEALAHGALTCYDGAPGSVGAQGGGTASRAGGAKRLSLHLPHPLPGGIAAVSRPVKLSSGKVVVR